MEVALVDERQLERGGAAERRVERYTGVEMQPYLWTRDADDRGRAGAVEAGHVDVEQNNVGFVFEREGDRRVPSSASPTTCIPSSSINVRSRTRVGSWSSAITIRRRSPTGAFDG